MSETKDYILDDVICPFAFGEWVLIDGDTSGQYIGHYNGKLHDVDVNGLRYKREIKDIKKDLRYKAANGI
jgi:hypothetical protein